MEIMSDLQRDLVEEVLARAPLTSLRAMRFTCTKWNNLSKNGSFIKKQIAEAKKKQAKEFEVIMVMNFRVYLMSVNLSNGDSSISTKGKLIRLNDANHQVDIRSLFHCNGLLLCITTDSKARLVVWNPCFGQTRWIKPRNSYHNLDCYALGYEKKTNNSHLSHKILRFVGKYYIFSEEEPSFEFELYSFDSNSWKVVGVTPPPQWECCYQRGLSLKGNTYWYAKEKHPGEQDFLICFDFTTETFGPHLPLPFHSSSSFGDTVALSNVGEEQLAVLYQCEFTLRMEIWVTSKIEPKEVSWDKVFLAVDMTPLTGFRFSTANFFIDQKQNVAVVFDRDEDSSRSIAYVIGKEGYFQKVDFDESIDPNSYPVMCSYVPSSVQI
ncbi:F-box protein [Cardamine amara subsp. amara]|uniref:F-box protein n=1 Tax=Cardamine amara subsp. amara TaxID=228776 RepID=A0ABD1BKY8_CARAN